MKEEAMSTIEPQIPPRVDMPQAPQADPRKKLIVAGGAALLVIGLLAGALLRSGDDGTTPSPSGPDQATLAAHFDAAQSYLNQGTDELSQFDFSSASTHMELAAGEMDEVATELQPFYPTIAAHISSGALHMHNAATDLSGGGLAGVTAATSEIRAATSEFDAAKALIPGTGLSW